MGGQEIAQVPAMIFDAETIVTQLTPTITWGNFFLPPYIVQSNELNYKGIATNNKTYAVKTCSTKYSAEHIKFDGNNTFGITQPTLYTIALSTIN